MIKMEERITFTRSLKILCIVFMLIGAATFVYGFITAPDQTWSNFLLNNYYFLSLAIGASFFFALQYITQSGWSSGFKRIPEAMMSYIPVAAVFFVLIYFGMHSLYHWTHAEAVQTDELIAHKSPYLNIPFFYIRLILFFAAWIILTRLLRKYSLKEDQVGGMEYFRKSEYYSRVLIFVLAFTFTFGVLDWIKSIDVHWFSTMFALKNFVGAFHHASAVILLIVLILNWQGKLSFFNKDHLLDFSRYLFMPAIIWGYLWFAEFMIIWYANIPEETVYFVTRFQEEWKILFFATIIMNWGVPFLFLMPKPFGRNKRIVLPVILVLIIGQWIDLYLQIMPGTTGENHFGFIEVGTFIGYAGLFVFVVSYALSKASLVPGNHPYLEESLQHHL